MYDGHYSTEKLKSCKNRDQYFCAKNEKTKLLTDDPHPSAKTKRLQPKGT